LSPSASSGLPVWVTSSATARRRHPQGCGHGPPPRLPWGTLKRTLMHSTPPQSMPATFQSSPPRQGAAPSSVQIDFSGWVEATAEPEALRLGVEGFSYPDLFVPERLAELSRRFDDYLGARDGAALEALAGYRRTKGTGMTNEAISEVLLA